MDRARTHIDAVAANPEQFAEQSFHDPGALLPLWRQPGPHLAAVLAARPGARTDARALHYLIVALARATQGSPDVAAAWDSVRAIVEPLSAARPDDDGYHAQLAFAYAGLGRCDDALREAARATDLLPVSRDAITGPQRLQGRAEVEAACGHAEDAIDHLTQLLALPSFVTKALLRVDPAYAPLRGNARFERLIENR